MEKFDSLRLGDKVTVTILGPDNQVIYQSTNFDYHSIESAIESALNKADLKVNPEDCVFEVTNHDTDVSHKYRINAHGNLKLIV